MSCGINIQARPAPGRTHTGHRGRNGIPRSPGRSLQLAPPGSLTLHLGRHILARLMCVDVDDQLSSTHRRDSCANCDSWVRVSVGLRGLSDLPAHSRRDRRGRLGFSAGSPNNLPLFHIAPAHFEGDKPAVFGQNFGQVDCTLPISDGVRSDSINISRGHGGFVPVSQEPVQELWRTPVRLFARRFGWWWPSPIQSFKQARHRHHPLIYP